MKPIVSFICIAVLFASCKAYQVNTISSSNTQKSDSTGVFKVENDSLLITFNFAGDNSPVNVEVLNKLNEPMIINWERSALIVGDKAYSYVDDNLRITGQTTGTTSRYYSDRNNFSDLSYSSGSISGNIQLSKNESFLPPHSKSGRSIYVLSQIPLQELDKTAFNRIMLQDVDGISQIISKTADYTAENSPLKFRNYITLYTLKDNQPRPFSYQQDFFVSSVTKLNVNPKNAIKYNTDPGDVMINSRTTGFTKTMAVLGTVGVVGGLTALEVNQKNKEKR